MRDTKNRTKAIATSTPRPFLKWVGGKAKLLPEISKYYPTSYGTFYEPFVGGGAMFFSLNPKTAHINDLNLVLISAYKHIRDDLEKLIVSLQELELHYHSLPSLEEKKLFFLAQREIFNSLPNNSFNKTVLLIFLNKTCFNGMYRENSKGGFNVPFGKHEKPKICDANNLERVSEALQNTTITHSSYEQAVSTAKKNDFVYFDPPYHPLNTTSSFTSYQAGGFTEQDQVKLRDEFKRLSDIGCKVMLSNSDSSLINELYKDFNIHKIHAARSINSVGTKRGKILELLITNY